MKSQQRFKTELFCEECGYQSETLTIVKKFFLVCKDCVEAIERRARFLREEKDWNRGVDQKDTK
jgi:hypothetical protein